MSRRNRGDGDSFQERNDRCNTTGACGRFAGQLHARRLRNSSTPQLRNSATRQLRPSWLNLTPPQPRPELFTSAGAWHSCGATNDSRPESPIIGKGFFGHARAPPPPPHPGSSRRQKEARDTRPIKLLRLSIFQL
jgi:hypothetical protein